jgi:hypothetical protein
MGFVKAETVAGERKAVTSIRSRFREEEKAAASQKALSHVVEKRHMRS